MESLNASATEETRVPQFLTIVEDGDTFPFVWEEFNGTEFDLRIVSDAKHKQIRRENTKRKIHQGQPQEITDWTAVTEVCLEHAIVSIRGLKKRGGKTIDFDALDYAQQNRIKGLLPERCKAEIIRLCVGKEAGESTEKK